MSAIGSSRQEDRWTSHWNGFENRDLAAVF